LKYFKLSPLLWNKNSVHFLSSNFFFFATRAPAHKVARVQLRWKTTTTTVPLPGISLLTTVKIEKIEASFTRVLVYI